MALLPYTPTIVIALLVVAALAVPTLRRAVGRLVHWWRTAVPARVGSRIALALVVLGPAASYLFDGLTGAARFNFTVGLLVAGTLIYVLPALAAKNDRDAAARAQDAVSTALLPLAFEVRGAMDPTNGSFDVAREGVINVALSSTVSLVGGTDNIRASYYKVTGRAGKRRMEPQRSHGRTDKAKTIFREDEPVGRALFTALTADEASVCDDVDTDPPTGWVHQNGKHSWQSFVGVPIKRHDGKLLGMLVVDSPQANDFNAEREVALLLLVAYQLATVLARRS